MNSSCFSATLLRYQREALSKEAFMALWTSFPAISQLQQRLNYTFHSQELLMEALTHRSFVNEWPHLELPYNERLEFLGDALLGSFVALTLFRRFPEISEGELSRARVSMVSGSVLLPWAHFLELPNIMLLGKGSYLTQNQGRHLWADGIEALIGAIYLDAGEESWKNVISGLFTTMQQQGIIPQFEELMMAPKDAKSQLQEQLSLFHQYPEYLLIDEGPEGDEKRFLVSLQVEGCEWERVWARTKKEGHQFLARKALARLKEKQE